MSTNPDFPTVSLIVCGLPGSGKSSLVQELARYLAARTRIQGGRRLIPCEADAFRTVNGEYVFDPKKNSACHAQCLAQFLHALSSPGQMPVVANVGVNEWERSPYMLASLAKRCVPLIYVMPRVEIDVLLRRGLHGVPRQTLETMQATLDTHPPAQGPYRRHVLPPETFRDNGTVFVPDNFWKVVGEQIKKHDLLTTLAT